MVPWLTENAGIKEMMETARKIRTRREMDEFTVTFRVKFDGI